jgi:hypothetical protein
MKSLRRVGGINHLSLILPCGVLPSDFLTKIPYTFLFLPYAPHVLSKSFLLDFIAGIKLGEEHKS